MAPQPTQIECIRIREGGTRIDLDGTKYLFAPQPDGRHIAAVANASHVSILLAIPAYRLADGGAVVVGDDDDTPAPTIAPAPAVPVADETPVPNDAPLTASADSTALEDMDDDALRALFEKAVGRKPSPRAGRDTLIDQIRQADTAD